MRVSASSRVGWSLKVICGFFLLVKVQVTVSPGDTAKLVGSLGIRG